MWKLGVILALTVASQEVSEKNSLSTFEEILSEKERLKAQLSEAVGKAFDEQGNIVGKEELVAQVKQVKDGFEKIDAAIQQIISENSHAQKSKETCDWGQFLGKCVPHISYTEYKLCKTAAGCDDGIGQLF